MSSLYTRSKEYTRSRKAQPDSPPSSPSPIAKTLRVSSLFLSVLTRRPARHVPWAEAGAGTSFSSPRRPAAAVCFAERMGKPGRCLCSHRFGASCRSPCAGALGISGGRAVMVASPLLCFSQKHRSPGRLRLEKNLADENEGKPEQLVTLRSSRERFDAAGETRFALQPSPWGCADRSCSLIISTTTITKKDKKKKPTCSQRLVEVVN